MSQTGTPAVTVITPVFETGPYIRPLLDALDAQHPVDGGFEAIFVDDGSTDATPDLLEAWAATRPWAQVIRIANSGWPSRPRNVALEHARGEFVFFVDHDDALTADALTRMVAFGRRTGADIVIGRMAGHGRAVPVRLFDVTVEDARAPETPLPASMTVHAMFRRDFLTREGLQFDETRRRLEDHMFMAAAYTSAARVSVLSDDDVYVHTTRNDSGNAGFRRYDPDEYYAALARAVDIVVAKLPPGPERNAYLARWTRREIIRRLNAVSVRALPHRDAFFRAAQRVLREHVPPDAIEALPAGQRKQAKHIMDASPETFWAAQGDTARIRLARRAGPLQGRLIAWRRSPRMALRDATRVLAWGTVVAAVLVTALAVAGTAGAAGAVTVGWPGVVALALAVTSLALTAWLAVRALSGVSTAVRQALALVPAAIVAVFAADLWLGVGVVVAGAVVGLALAADRRWRRTDVRGFPAPGGPGLSRLGWIGTTAIGVGLIVAAVDAWALLGR